jgi:ribonuclease P protein component
MLLKKYRLKNKNAFNATYKIGNSYHKGGITLFCGKIKHPEKKDIPTKIGFVVSKKIHKRAVKRNRIKRLMREAVRLYIKSAGINFDTKYISLIFTASSKLLDKDFNYINNNIKELMEKIK